ncbi:MAG: DnaJ domain-containing protein [Nitrospirae bacterium]|nr:DnaJ domain-containing protein [Nitrospirota bacterium]
MDAKEPPLQSLDPAFDFAGPFTWDELPRILLRAQAARAAGRFVFRGAGAEKVVWLDEGMVVFATSNLGDDRLGEMLIRAGMITLDQYDESVRLIKETGKKQGVVLVEMGALTPKDLFGGLKFQVREIVVSLFSWPEGRAVFIPPAEGEMPPIRVHFSPRSLILEGIRRRADSARLRRRLPPRDAVVRLNRAALLEEGPAILLPEEQKIVEAADGGPTVAQILDRTEGEEFSRLKALYALASAGLCVVEGGTATVEPEPGPDRESEEAFREKAAPPPSPTPEPAEPSISPGPSPEPKTSPVSGAAPSGAEDEEETPETIRRFLDGMEGKTHYEILGVSEETDARVVRRAYLRLVKRFHPDLHTHKGLEGAKEDLEEIFMRANDAYEVLSDEARRKEYDLDRFGLKESEKEKEQQTQAARAAEQFARGKAELEKGNFWGAEELFKWAVRLDPTRANHYYFLATAQSRIPKRLHEAEENIQKAIEIAPSRPDYHVLLGQIYLRGGLKARAVKKFMEALNWNPSHPGALKGIEEAGEEKPASAIEEAGGVLGRFFGKKEKD